MGLNLSRYVCLISDTPCTLLNIFLLKKASNISVFQKKFVREAYKPSSVIGGHLSRPIVTGGFKRNPESLTGRLKRSFVSCCGWGLHRGRVARPRVSSYLTFPPLHILRYAVSLCCTFPGVAPAGRYPALCPMQLGLSSHLFGARPPGSLTNSRYFSTGILFCQRRTSVTAVLRSPCKDLAAAGLNQAQSL